MRSTTSASDEAIGRPPRGRFGPGRPAAAVVGVAFLLAGLGGCAVVAVAGAAVSVAGSAVSVAGTVVATGVKVTGKVVEKTVVTAVDLVVP